MSNNSEPDSADSQGMRQPAERSTLNRDEMMCTECLEEGLEEHPGYIDEYGGKTALRKATRCPNEDCDNHYRMNVEEVEMQMPDGRLAGLNVDIPIQDIGIAVLVLAAGAYFALSAGIIPTGSDTTTASTPTTELTGTIDAAETSGQVVVETDGETLRTVDTTANSGEFTVSDIEPGSYNIYFDPDGTETAATPPTAVELTDSGVAVDSSETVKGDGNTVRFVPQDTRRLSINQTFKSASYQLDYDNGANAQPGVEATLYPIKSGSKVRQKSLSTTDTEPTPVLLPTIVSSQEVRVESPVTTVEKTINSRHDGAPQEFRAYGNLNPASLDITLENSSKSPIQTKQVRVDGTQTAQIQVQSQQTIGAVDVTFSRGTATKQQTASGKWTDGTISVDTPSEGFVDATIIVEPQRSTSRIQETGTIQDGEVKATIDGNSPATNAYLNFTGGSATNTIVATQTASVNASDGTDQAEQTLVENLDSKGDFQLQLTPTVSQNEDNTEFAYLLNGRKTTTPIETTERLQLSAGDTLKIQATAEGDFLGPIESPYGGDQSPLDITSVTAQQSGSPSDISVSATITNPTSSRQTKQLELYVDGDRVIGQSTTLEADETRQVSVASTSLSGDGTHTIHVSDGPVETYKLGTQSAQYGEGRIDATLERVGNSGTVDVDTTGDGSFDCTVPARGGACSLGELNTGPVSYTVREKAVSQTGYTLIYDQTVNPKNVSIDVGNDGTIEIQRSGTLSAPVTQSVELAPGKTEIGIQNSNNVPLNYTLAWESQAAINNPSVYIDGEPALTKTGVFAGPDTRSTKQLNQGDHEFRFDTNKGAYTATIKWREQGEASYPSVQINGADVCRPTDFSNNLTCRLSDTQLQPGSHTIDFTGGKSAFNYQLSQQARAVAKTVRFSLNGDQARFPRPTPAPESWSQQQQTRGLTVGKNTVSLDANSINGIQPEATATLLYEYDVSRSENPQVVVTDSTGVTNTKQIPDSSVVNGRLVEPTSITLPPDWFTTGVNDISVNTDNNGAVRMKLTTEMSQNGTVDINYNG